MKRVLTEKRKEKLYAFLKNYLVEVLEDEDYLNTFDLVYEDAYRVKVYGYLKNLTVDMIKEYLQGLPLGTMYITDNIVDVMCKAVGVAREDKKENDMVLDNFYWHTLARIIYEEGR